jgi:hypothetical protein
MMYRLLLKDIERLLASETGEIEIRHVLSPDGQQIGRLEQPVRIRLDDLFVQDSDFEKLVTYLRGEEAPS